MKGSRRLSHYNSNHPILKAAVAPFWEDLDHWGERFHNFYHRALLDCMSIVPPKKFAAIIEECKRRDAEDMAKRAKA